MLVWFIPLHGSIVAQLNTLLVEPVTVVWLHFSHCPPGGSGFTSDPALMDFGQSSPEDEDLYSTRSWRTAVGGTSLPHYRLRDQRIKRFVLLWSLNRPSPKRADIESLLINISIWFFFSPHLLFSHGKAPEQFAHRSVCAERTER